jgi:hypothetical protein
MTTFKEELRSKVLANGSELLLPLKEAMLKAAANGKTSITITSSKYDSSCLLNLRLEGLAIKVFRDSRDRELATISWLY